MITKKVTLNEILARFDDEGVLRGVHVCFLTRIVDEDTGEVLSAKVEDPCSLEQAQALGVADVDAALQEVTKVSAAAAAIVKA